MEKLNIEPTHVTPEIRFIPEENIFIIRGMSSPEDVRTLYYPVTEWMNKFYEEVVQGNYKIFNDINPIRFKIDLEYFNSASAKFLFDIILELKKLRDEGIPVVTEWYYYEDDTDMTEAREDISELIQLGFTYIAKS